jgi:glycosyltransferase involved in cell wall biosynthesis
MSRDQAAMGHDVTVLTIRRDPDRPHVEQRDGYTVVRYDSVASPLGNDLSPGIAEFLASASEIDVIHAHSHLYFSTNLAALKRRLDDVPLAITNHGLYSQNAPEWVFDLYLRSIGRWTFNQADVIFCYTEEDRDRVRKFGVNSRIKVVPNGIDTDRLTPQGPTSERISHDGPVILFVGRLVEGKRPRDTIRSVSTLAEERDVKLCIVGGGLLRSKLEEMAGDCVQFLGQVPHDEMPGIYRAGDVLMLPSRAEGLPRTVLEAFASGIPVVSSHLEHTAPIVQQGGETAPIGDIEGYIDALQRVLDDCDSLGDAGRETVVETYRWRETVEQTTRVLESLL